jgi:hypothetical protein
LTPFVIPKGCRCEDESVPNGLQVWPRDQRQEATRLPLSGLTERVMSTANVPSENAQTLAPAPWTTTTRDSSRPARAGQHSNGLSIGEPKSDFEGTPALHQNTGGSVNQALRVLLTSSLVACASQDPAAYEIVPRQVPGAVGGLPGAPQGNPTPGGGLPPTTALIFDKPYVAGLGDTSLGSGWTLAKVSRPSVWAGRSYRAWKAGVRVSTDSTAPRSMMCRSTGSGSGRSRKTEWSRLARQGKEGR